MEKGMVCGCVVDGDNIPCVFDDPDYTVADCCHAIRLHADGKGRDDCEHWKPLADEEHAASQLDAGTSARDVAFTLMALGQVAGCRGSHAEILAEAVGEIVRLQTENESYKVALDEISHNGWPLEMRNIALKALAQEAK